MHSEFHMSIIFDRKIKAALENLRHSVASFFFIRKNIVINMRPLLDKLTIRGPQSPQWVVRSPRPLPKYQIAKPLTTAPNRIRGRGRPQQMEFVGKAAPEHVRTLLNRRAANPRHTEIFHRHPGHRAYIEHAKDVAIENQKQFGRIAESDIIGVPARTHSPPTKRLAISFACRRSSQPPEIPEEDRHKT